jgi:hypothetical protein
MYCCLRLAFMLKIHNPKITQKTIGRHCVSGLPYFSFSRFSHQSGCTTIFQTCKYDGWFRDGSAYLKADYSIEYKDEQHQNFRIYAFAMGLLYCMGIPLYSFLLLYSTQDKIQELQVLQYSRVMVDDLITDETLTASVRKREAAIIFKAKGRDVMMEEVTSGDIEVTSGDIIGKILLRNPKRDLRRMFPMLFSPCQTNW